MGQGLEGVTAGKEDPFPSHCITLFPHTASVWLQAHLSDELQVSGCHRPPCPGLEVICQCLPLLLLLQILSQRETWELPEPSQETWGGHMTGM